MTTLILSMNWFSVTQLHKVVTEQNVKFHKRDRNSSLLGTQNRSSEFEVEMLKEASCATTHCANCALHRTRARKLLCRSQHPLWTCIFHWWGCVKASGRLFEHLIWMSFTVVCVHFELTNFSVGLRCVMFMSTVAVGGILSVFSAWVTIKYHAWIWNLKCVFCCKFPLLQYWQIF